MRRREWLELVGVGLAGSAIRTEAQSDSHTYRIGFGGLNVYWLQNDACTIYMASSTTHVPVLAVPETYLASGSAAPDRSRGQTAFYDLRGWTVSVRDSDVPGYQGLRRDCDGKGNGARPSGGNWSDLGWVIRLKDLSGGRLKPEDELLDQLAAKVVIRGGSLRGIGASKAMVGRWTFKSANNATKFKDGRALANLLQFETSRRADTLDVWLSKVGTKKVVKLKPSQGVNTSAEIHHATLEDVPRRDTLDILLDQMDRAASACDRSMAAKHFAELYSLFTGLRPEADRLLPHFLGPWPDEPLCPAEAESLAALPLGRRINGSQACPPMIFE